MKTNLIVLVFLIGSPVIALIIGGALFTFGRLRDSSLHAFIGPERPVLVDIDRDGFDDVIGMGWDFGGSDHVVAVSGSDAEVMWMHNLGDVDFEDIMVLVPSGGPIVYADRGGRLRGIDRTSGDETWEANVGERVVAACPSDAGAVLLRTADQMWFRVDLANGRSTRTRSTAPCGPVPQVGDDRVIRTTEMVGWARGGFRPGLPGEQRAWHDSEYERVVAVIAGTLDDRTVAELAVLDAEGRLLWRSVVAAQPELARPNLHALHVHGDVLYAVYNMTRRSAVPRRIAAFDLATGARRWDAPLEGSRDEVDFLFADARRVYVVHWALEILDATDGRRIGRVGIFNGETQ